MTALKRRTAYCALIALVIVGGLRPFATARADVVISTAQTRNMACAVGVCAPTAKNAVLNVGDLVTMLASGNIEVSTTGSSVQAKDIDVNAAVSWSDANTLALDAFESVAIKKQMMISGLGGLSVTTNDGGSTGIFSFEKNGQITFANLSSALTINGAPYALFGDIATLASAIAANPAGDYALANDYDASGDGTYQNSPIPTQFSGAFEGLGNTISSLSIVGNGEPDALGLFAELASNNQPGGSVANIVLKKVNITGNGFTVGGLVGFNIGTINGSFASGSVSSSFDQIGPIIGMLVGANYGTITRSGAAGTVMSGNPADAGGLAGASVGVISESYADCNVSGGSMSAAAGLVGQNEESIGQSYAVGKTAAGAGSDVGGLVGMNTEGSAISQTYSTAAVKLAQGSPRGYRGGLIGIDYSPSGNNTFTYWDTETSHVKNPAKGAGHPKSDPGITGLTTEQLQSGLPQGFDPKVWTEDPNINGGLPYLNDNPPR